MFEGIEGLCAPALIYVIYGTTRIIVETYKGLYNLALMQIFITIIFTYLLNVLCRAGMGIISWIIVFIPFFLMSIIAGVLLVVFGLNPATGKQLYPVTKPPEEPGTENPPSDDEGEPIKVVGTPGVSEPAEGEPGSYTNSYLPCPDGTTVDEYYNVCIDNKTQVASTRPTMKNPDKNAASQAGEPGSYSNPYLDCPANSSFSDDGSQCIDKTTKKSTPRPTIYGSNAQSNGRQVPLAAALKSDELSVFANPVTVYVESFEGILGSSPRPTPF